MSLFATAAGFLVIQGSRHLRETQTEYTLDVLWSLTRTIGAGRTRQPPLLTASHRTSLFLRLIVGVCV